MEAAVVDAGSKFLKAGPAIPDQAPSMVINLINLCPLFGGWENTEMKKIFFLGFRKEICWLSGLKCDNVTK